MCSAGWSCRLSGEEKTARERKKRLAISLIGDCARCPPATDAASCTAERLDGKERKRGQDRDGGWWTMREGVAGGGMMQRERKRVSNRGEI